MIQLDCIENKLIYPLIDLYSIADEIFLKEVDDFKKKLQIERFVIGVTIFFLFINYFHFPRSSLVH